VQSGDIERRRRQNLNSPRQDARGVAPSIRSFALAIDRQRQGVERIPVLAGTRGDLVAACTALDSAEVAAIALSLDEPEAELLRFQEAARAVSVPVLRTDLLLEEFQIYESRVAGADAVLLHAGVMPPELLARLAQAAKSTHMAACIACTSDKEIAQVAPLGPAVIALPSALLHLAVPPRSLVLALSAAPDLRGRADAMLDEALGVAPDPASAFRATLEKDS
jgi:indole-3-glycerol phosphate synthase